MAKTLQRAREPELEDDEGNEGGPGVVDVPNIVDDVIIDDDKKQDVVANITPNRETQLENDRELEEDTRLAYDEDSEGDHVQRRSRRQRRNETRRMVMTQKDQQIEELSTKVDMLTTHLARLSAGQQGITMQTLDSELSRAQQALTLADQEMARVVSSGDGSKLPELMRLRDEASARVWQINAAKTRLERAAQEREVEPDPRRQQRQPGPQGGQRQPSLDDRAQAYVETFMSRYPYFDPNGQDEDSVIMKAIDDKVAAEGYLPNTPMYWQVLERRLRARGFLPETGSQEDARNDDGQQEQPAPRAPMSRGGRPPLSAARGGTGARTTGFRLEPYMREYLEGEGILHADGLDEEQKAKRSRLITQWKKNTELARKGLLGKQ